MSDSSCKSRDLDLSLFGFEPSLSMSDDSTRPAVDSHAARTMLGDEPNAFWLGDEPNALCLGDEIFRSGGGTDVGAALAHFHEQMRQPGTGREPLLLIVTDGPPDPEAVEAVQEHLRAANLPTPEDILAHEVPHVPKN